MNYILSEGKNEINNKNILYIYIYIYIERERDGE